MSLIEEVKKKKEFSRLPGSIVDRVLMESGDDVKEARKLLRKYFGVFLTNRVLRGKGDLLKVHLSSKKRNYERFYGEIFSDIGKVKSVVDLGCGVNGFSYEFLPKGVEYVGIDASGQVVDHVNKYFKKGGFDGRAVVGDLFDIDLILDKLKNTREPRVVFMFQVVDALESMKRDFSKKLISVVMGECEYLVISLPTISLGGRKRFDVSRRWLVDFLVVEFVVVKDFEMFGERVLIVGKGK